MSDPRPTKKGIRDDKEVELVLCARCIAWTVRGERCEHCRQLMDWDPKK